MHCRNVNTVLNHLWNKSGGENRTTPNERLLRLFRHKPLWCKRRTRKTMRSLLFSFPSTERFPHSGSFEGPPCCYLDFPLGCISPGQEKGDPAPRMSGAPEQGWLMPSRRDSLSGLLVGIVSILLQMPFQLRFGKAGFLTTHVCNGREDMLRVTARCRTVFWLPYFFIFNHFHHFK